MHHFLLKIRHFELNEMFLFRFFFFSFTPFPSKKKSTTIYSYDKAYVFNDDYNKTMNEVNDYHVHCNNGSEILANIWLNAEI